MKNSIYLFLFVSGIFFFTSCESTIETMELDQVEAEVRSAEEETCYDQGSPFCSYQFINCRLTGSDGSSLNIDPSCTLFSATLTNGAPPGHLCSLSQEEQDNYFIFLQQKIDFVRPELAASCDLFSEYPVIPVSFSPHKTNRFDIIMHWACCPIER